MSGKQYLKNQLPVLLLNLLGVLALALFLIATGTSRQAIFFIALVWIVVVVCYLTVSFFIQKRHCETLLVMAEQLGEKYLMPEVSGTKQQYTRRGGNQCPGISGRDNTCAGTALWNKGVNHGGRTGRNPAASVV